MRRAFFATLFYISSTISFGNSTSSSKLRSTGDGPWFSAPGGEEDPGPLPKCVVRFEIGGVFVGAIDVFLASIFPLEAKTLASEASSLSTCLAAAALPLPVSGLCPTITEGNSEMRERGREWFVST